MLVPIAPPPITTTWARAGSALSVTDASCGALRSERADMLAGAEPGSVTGIREGPRGPVAHCQRERLLP